MDECIGISGSVNNCRIMDSILLARLIRSMDGANSMHVQYSTVQYVGYCTCLPWLDLT